MKTPDLIETIKQNLFNGYERKINTMKHDNKTMLRTEPIGKLLFKLAVPAVTAQVVNVLYNLVDRVYIGHIPDVGALALTGVGVCMPIIMLIMAFAALVSMGGAPRSTVKMGEGKQEDAESILGNCFILTLIISITLTIVFLIFGDKALMLFGASENTIDYAWSYLQIYVIGTIFVHISIGLNAFITAQGFAKTSMMTVLIGAILNIILDPIFIFGFNMGVRGAALATVLSQMVSAVWVLYFLSGKKTLLKLKPKNMRLNKKIILPCLALGIAPFIMQATESILVVCFNSSLLRYGGDLAVGTMTILFSVRQLFVLPLFGLTQGAQPIISYNFGAGDSQRVKSSFILLLKICIIYSVVLWLLVMVFPNAFARVFTEDIELISLTAWALRIYLSIGLILGIQTACQQTFIAIGNAKSSLFLAVLRKIVLLIPLIYIMPMFFTDKVLGVFLAEPIADFIAVCATGTLFYFQFRKAIREMSKTQQKI